jgi:predicted nuclease with TOPRIM domain
MADLTNIESRIQMISDNLTLQQNKLNLHLVDCEDDIKDINVKIAALQREDQELHQEIHDVAVNVDENTARIEAIESKDYQAQIDNINNQMSGSDDSLQKQIDEMDIEHHEELHKLAENIDVHTSRINTIEVTQANIPEHVVLSEAQYEALGEPDTDKLYFVYEE